jgi:hypothetical protein
MVPAPTRGLILLGFAGSAPKFCINNKHNAVNDSIKKSKKLLKKLAEKSKG